MDTDINVRTIKSYKTYKQGPVRMSGVDKVFIAWALLTLAAFPFVLGIWASGGLLASI